MKPKILIAEDELIIAKVNAIMLGKLGYDVEIVKNAADVITATNTFNPDVVLMDIQFKKGTPTGVDAAIKIRKESDVPIIFTSGNKPDSIGEIENTYHLTKPVDFKDLKKNISKLITN